MKIPNAQAVITGARRFHDTVEGKTYDFTKIYVEEPLASNDGNAKGQCTVEFQCGGHEVFDQLGTVFPISAEVQIVTEVRSNKTLTTLKVVKIHDGTKK